MVPKRVLLIFGLVVLFAASLTVFFLPHRSPAPTRGDGVVMGILAPFQKAATGIVRLIEDTWTGYFFLVSAAEENETLKRDLALAREENHRFSEVVAANRRLQELLNFKEEIPGKVVAARVVGRDPSSWFQTVIIDKGAAAGVAKSCPVVVAAGIVGQVISVSDRFAKVLLMTDRDSAVDALVQRTRARGVLKGDGEGRCMFQYLLRKEDIGVGDIIISSGMDGVFPKGLRVGQVSEVLKRNAGLFQEVVVSSFVDFEKLEEVLVVLPVPASTKGSARE